MPKRVNASFCAVCALLSIWICVIIFCVTGRENEAETMTKQESSRVLIIDPGHGGLDGGAVSVTGTCESVINWKIAEKIAGIAGFLGLETRMTRDTEQIEYPAEYTTISGRKKWDTRQRAEYVNGIDNGVLLSIHQNTYPAESPRGTQVFHAQDESSRRIAASLQESIAANLQQDNRRVAAPIGKNVYLMNHVICPAILVECGFLSNSAEARLLENDAYQMKLAIVIAECFRRQFTGEDSI